MVFQVAYWSVIVFVTNLSMHLNAMHFTTNFHVCLKQKCVYVINTELTNFWVANTLLKINVPDMHLI